MVNSAVTRVRMFAYYVIPLSNPRQRLGEIKQQDGEFNLFELLAVAVYIKVNLCISYTCLFSLLFLCNFIFLLIRSLLKNLRFYCKSCNVTAVLLFRSFIMGEINLASQLTLAAQHVSDLAGYCQPDLPPIVSLLCSQLKQLASLELKHTVQMGGELASQLSLQGTISLVCCSSKRVACVHPPSQRWAGDSLARPVEETHRGSEWIGCHSTSIHTS